MGGRRVKTPPDASAFQTLSSPSLLLNSLTTGCLRSLFLSKEPQDKVRSFPGATQSECLWKLGSGAIFAIPKLLGMGFFSFSFVLWAAAGFLFCWCCIIFGCLEGEAYGFNFNGLIRGVQLASLNAIPWQGDVLKVNMVFLRCLPS